MPLLVRGQKELKRNYVRAHQNSRCDGTEGDKKKKKKARVEESAIQLSQFGKSRGRKNAHRRALSTAWKRERNIDFLTSHGSQKSVRYKRKEKARVIGTMAVEPEVVPRVYNSTSSDLQE